MLKVTGHYGSTDKIKADLHAVFVVRDTQPFNAAVKAACPEIAPIIRQARENGDFSGKAGESLPIITASHRYLLVGLGDQDKLTLEIIRRAAGRASKAARTFAAPTVAMYCPADEMLRRQVQSSFEDGVDAIVTGALLASYRYDEFITRKDEDEKKRETRELQIVTTDEGFQGRLKNAIINATAVVEGVELARDLSNAPSNELSADALAKRASAIGRKFTIKTVILNQKEILANKMGGLLAVNQGSGKDPRFIVMEYNDKKRRLPAYVIVGKGVTFDSGGISIKPAASMDEMKMDMSGAAAVLGTMYAVAKLKLPIRLVALIPATDNMSGSNAICPGDIIRIADGTTVEIKNTDAEGRLILADALVYAQRFKPRAIIDLATLTGACVVALASHATGMMGTSREVMDGLKTAGEKTYERVWELPLFEEYDEMMKSDVADLKNLGGKWGGAITAAAFLKNFVGDYPWVHLDIAGTAMLESATDYLPKGGTGVGVRLLTQFFQSVPE